MHDAIRAALIANSEPWKLPVMQRFFKDPIDAYCTYTLHVRNLAKQHGAEFASWPETDRTALATALWESGKFEEGTMAILLYSRMRRKLDKKHWNAFSRWLTTYVRNWAHCDALCAEVLGPMMIAHPERISDMKTWAASKAKYKRRAALVAPIKGIRKGLFLLEIEEICALLAADCEDIVKKGIVWLRREMAR